MAATTKQVRFMQNNFALDATLTASSELADFPATNTALDNRYDAWLAAGNFDIESSNSKIYINDGGDKTVTITAGAYTADTLATEIQTQLNASSSDWLCTYSDTTFKFTISRTSGTNTLRHTQTTDAAWDTLGYTLTADDITGPFPAQEQRNHTSEWLMWDFGYAPQPSAFMAVCPISETFSPSSNATFKLQANNADSWSVPPLDITLDYTDLGSFLFMDDLADTEYRFWRLYIVDKQHQSGPSGTKMGHVYIGDYITPTTTNIQIGIAKSLLSSSSVTSAVSGAKFSNKRARRVSITGNNIVYLTESEREDLEQTFYDLDTTDGFYISIDPSLAVSSRLDMFTKFVRFTSQPGLRHVFNDRWSVTFNIDEVV